MFEYMNNGILIMGTVSLIATLLAMILRSGKAIHENREIGFPYLLTLFLFITVGIMVQDGLSAKEKVLNNIEVFNKSGTLRCNTLGSTYIVSKSKGWQRHKEGFTKDDLFFSLDVCIAEEK